MSSKKIWVIEQGEYSDYRVRGVFSTKANAERIRDALGEKESYDAPTVAEWTLDPIVAELDKGYTPWAVLMLRDGTVESCKQEEITSYRMEGGGWLWKRSTAPAYIGKGVPDALNWTVWAKDGKHAVKILNERRTQMIATGEWP